MKWTSLKRKQVWVISITKACRLVAANFMLQNPELTKIGGVDIDGNPIVVQVDETHCRKMKYNKGKPKISTWVLGGVEMPVKTDHPPNAPKFFDMIVPNHNKIPLISTLKYKILENQ